MLKIGFNIKADELKAEIDTDNKYKFSFNPYYQNSIIEQIDELDIDPIEFGQKFGLEYNEDEEYFTLKGIEYNIDAYLPAWQEIFNTLFQDEIVVPVAVVDHYGEYDVTLITIKPMTLKEFIKTFDGENIYLFGGEVADGDYNKLINDFNLGIIEAY